LFFAIIHQETNAVNKKHLGKKGFLFQRKPFCEID